MGINQEYKLTKYACYVTNISMAVVVNLSALLFVTFREMYNLSFTKLGLLVAINFSIQLFVDLIFTFFAKMFNIHKTVRYMSLITFFGILIYGIMPTVFPDLAYLWIVAGTVVFCGMIGAAVYYLVASLSLNQIVGLVACIMTGIFVSMLWPGAIICVGKKFPPANVAAYALLASGGDMGASVAPQLVGVVSDKVALSNFAIELSKALDISAEQIGMRVGLLVSTVFPVLGIILVLCLKVHFIIRDNTK